MKIPVTAPIPWSRVIRERRRALWPLAIALVANVIVLVAVVLPLSRRVDTNERRAEQAARSQTAAQAEYRAAEEMREGKAQATQDLATFYESVLPANVAAARRILQSKVLALAEEHGVEYRSGSANTQEARETGLERLVFSLTLSGLYDDIRAMIYDLETAPEFIVIDNIVLSEAREGEGLTWALELSTYYRAPVARTGANGR
jgi:Tfp pilus assembly protein PilO